MLTDEEQLSCTPVLFHLQLFFDIDTEYQYPFDGSAYLPYKTVSANGMGY